VPRYAYKCALCDREVEETRRVKNRYKRTRCGCGGLFERNMSAEGKPQSGELPDWTSVNAGVAPDQVPEANRYYAHLGVTFDPHSGNAHVPGRNRRKFLKLRGLAEL